MKHRRRPTLVKVFPRLQRCGYCLVRASKTTGGTRKQTDLLIGPAQQAGLATIPSSSLRVGSVRRLDSLWLWDLDQTTGETNCSIAKVISNDILDRNVRFREDGTFWCKTFCRPLRNVMTWLEELVNHGLNGSGHACIQYPRAFFALGRLGRRQAGTLISCLRCFVHLARSCGAEVEDHQKCIPHVVACAL